MAHVLSCISVLLAVAGGESGDPTRTGATSPSVPRQQAEFFEIAGPADPGGNCQSCHGPKKQEAGLRLDTRVGVLKGTDSRPRGRAGKARAEPADRGDQSFRSGQDAAQEAPCRPQAVADLTEWVKMGAPWPEPKGRDRPARAASPGTTPLGLSARRGPRHCPRSKDTSWPTTSVDPFILCTGSRRRGLRLRPRRPADPDPPRHVRPHRPAPHARGGRRLRAGCSPDAYARLIDRLLASPHYGERWARHWLDVARYADTKGYVFFQDANFHWAYTYRDYVIRAFNDDLPFDRFLVEQLAADRLPQGEPTSDPLAALGFLTLGGRFMNNFHDIIDDRIDVVSRGLMGLTVGCARCHDHKFDPISSTGLLRPLRRLRQLR